MKNDEIIKACPNPARSKNDSELAQTYRNWFYNERTEYLSTETRENIIKVARYELDKALLRMGDLETALKCANVCNEIANKNNGGMWGSNSPFQKKIEELVGKSPYGDKE